MTHRRDFLRGLAVATLAASPVASAQTARKQYRIGILNAALPADSVGPQPKSPSVAALLRGMRDLGYVYGENFVTEPRGTSGVPERFPQLAAELVRLNVDVIVAPGFAMPALVKATSTIPVVMSAGGDPVGSGWIRSLGQPGGNVTGLSLQTLETTGKRLELLKELVPAASPVAVVWEPFARKEWTAAETAARRRGWKLLSLEIREPGAIEEIFKATTAARAGAILACADSVFFPHMDRVIELADRHQIPVMYDVRPYVDAGGLISYSADIIEIWARAAAYVDKILKGANPANLPVEQPKKFELVINLKAAKSIGLTVPPSLLSRADELIH